MKFTVAALSFSLAAHSAAVPLANEALEKRQLLTGVLTGAIEGLTDAVSSGNVAGIQSLLQGTQPGQQPSSPEEARNRLQRIVQNDKPKNIYEYITRLAVNGLLADPLTSLIKGVGGQFTDKNSFNNQNNPSPKKIYPKKFSCDADYTISEGALRQAIYIPPTFTFGAKPPVILFPGTGNTGYQTFAGNFIKQLTGASWADPVWVNVPNSLLDDAQKSAQYAAYAINYIAAVTRRKVAITSWSQGCINTQWAFKYYPSTRAVTTDHLAISGDYKGTIEASFICPDGLLSCAPSVLQQQYLGGSNYITALRSNGGDSAYVPTTTLYSALFDEVVQPQEGTGASAYINDARGVGATNVEAQSACAGKLGGTFYTHEGALYQPLAIALLKDAMTHDGPAKLERIDTSALCGSYLGEGLNLGDLLVTENAVAIAGLQILLGQPRTLKEPDLLAFASKAPKTCSA